MSNCGNHIAAISCEGKLLYQCETQWDSLLEERNKLSTSVLKGVYLLQLVRIKLIFFSYFCRRAVECAKETRTSFVHVLSHVEVLLNCHFLDVTEGIQLFCFLNAYLLTLFFHRKIPLSFGVESYVVMCDLPFFGKG